MKKNDNGLDLSCVPEYERNTVLYQNMQKIRAEIKDRARQYKSLAREVYGEQYIMLNSKGDALYEAYALIMEAIEGDGRNQY